MIEFTNVGLRYGQGPEILKDLNFRIEPGSFHFLTGPSGSGKTSLLKLLLLSLRPTRGRVTLFGKDTSALDQDALLQMRRHIGIVFQEFRLLDHLTTFENVALPLRVLGEPEIAYRANVTELLEWVGLGERMDALPAAALGRRKAARRHRPRRHRPPGHPARRRAHRQRRPRPVAAPGAALRRTQQDGHDHHPRHARTAAARQLPVPAHGARRWGGVVWLIELKLPRFAGIANRERSAAIVPERSVSGRTLVLLIAIMTFLSGVTLGGVVLVQKSAIAWSSDVGREVTIQIRPVEGEVME